MGDVAIEPLGRNAQALDKRAPLLHMY
jgi:hypothetical protein